MGLIKYLTVGELRKAPEGVPDDYLVALLNEWNDAARAIAVSVEIETISDHQIISDDGEKVLSIK